MEKHVHEAALRAAAKTTLAAMSLIAFTGCGRARPAAEESAEEDLAADGHGTIMAPQVNLEMPAAAPLPPAPDVRAAGAGDAAPRVAAADRGEAPAAPSPRPATNVRLGDGPTVVTPNVVKAGDGAGEACDHPTVEVVPNPLDPEPAPRHCGGPHQPACEPWGPPAPPHFHRYRSEARRAPAA